MEHIYLPKQIQDLIAKGVESGSKGVCGCHPMAWPPSNSSGALYNYDVYINRGSDWCRVCGYPNA